nr:putative RNA-directed DNA polymerase, eukaryota, reverse transcriptase zinc-binding domain protein [Tanacetum cinerariifolium]
ILHLDVADVALSQLNPESLSEEPYLRQLVFLNQSFDFIIGDPLSPFLFILAIEAHNVAILEAIDNNLFHGLKVGKDKIHVSHLQFTNDALILGEWSILNAKNLYRILTCFHLASGLKINFNKSKLFGIRVSSEELYSMAFAIGCLASQFPCTYLGLPIGAKMSRCRNWEPLIDSMGVHYFSAFKALKKIIHKLEGIRRRFFWGGNTKVDKVAWIAKDKSLLLQTNGGLRIGSLKASNQSLLAKW